MAAAIKPIDSSSVHHIQSGQVIIDLCSVVRELIENSIDAKSTSIGGVALPRRLKGSPETYQAGTKADFVDCLLIDVRFKNQGLELIEVQDNGGGIAPSTYALVALKHHTSKLSSFSDVASLKTFGFRGEALASLCALANVTITTCIQDDVPKGSRLSFESSGRLKDTTVVATQRGTTVSVDSLFHNLPVRRRELEKNIKREWEKVIVLLNQYACIQKNLKFTIIQQTAKQHRVVLFATRGNPSTRENIINIFGAKAVSTLISLDLDLELPSGFVAGSRMRTAACLATSSHKIRLVGHVSRPSPGNGRQTPDRQMFFVNGRPCRLPQFAKIFNEVYRSFNCVQLPFIFADILLDPDLYDVNVSPDKCTILLHEQSSLLDTLRHALTALFNSHDCAVPLNHAASDSNNKVMIDSPRNDCSATPGPKSLNFVFQKKRVRDSKTNAQPGDPESALGGTASPCISSFLSRTPEIQETQNSHIESDQRQSTNQLSPSPEVTHFDSEKNQVLESKTRSFEDSDTHIKCHGKPGGNHSSKWEIIEDQPIDSRCESRSRKVHNLRSAHRDNDSVSSDQSCSEPTTEISDVTTAKNSMANALLTSEKMQTSITGLQPEISKYCQGKTSQEAGRYLNALMDIDKMKSSRRPVSNDSASSGASDFTVASRSNTTRAHERLEPGNFHDHSIETDSGEVATKVTAKRVSLNDAPARLLEVSVKRNKSLMLATQHIQTDKASIRSRMDYRVTNWLAELHPYSRFCEIGDIDASDAESKLTLTVSRSDFSKLQIVGQFNKGFIISRRSTASDRTAIGEPQARHDELFIIDQHASDEKFNFEQLQVTAVVQSQQLVHPKRLQLSALEEEIVIGNLAAIQANGFKVSIDETGLLPVGSRCQLLTLPLTRETTFDLQDLDELIALLRDETCNSGHIPRPSKIRKILAMRACRSSVMIGKALTRTQMYTLVRHMGTLDKPWNCPHGRPTMRHLCRLDSWERKFWRCDSTAVAPSTWLSYSRTT